ncbi:MAG: hypothetical protein NTU43_02650 [Bacteroidetes bacterium]|nr:hypothetical protein [Bacteroidota bacterium]
MDVTGKLILVKEFLEIVSRLSELIKKYKNTTKPKESHEIDQRQQIVEAINAIQIASIKTNEFITTIGYEPNDELTELWQNALRKVSVIDDYPEELPEWLYRKAEFFGNPNEILNSPDGIKLVPTLQQINIACEQLLLTL